jgi:hypothetical protein
MREVEFVDTSVLLNILDVPGKNQDRQHVVEELREKTARGVQLIIPVSAVIETGNHITNLPDGPLAPCLCRAFREAARRGRPG